jgi:putative nucleotidyltransferase with HDIG domain
MAKRKFDTQPINADEFDFNAMLSCELLNHISSGIMVCRAIDNGSDFIILDLNKPGERISGLHKEYVVGKSILTSFPRMKDLGLFEVLQRVWKTGKSEALSDNYRDEKIASCVENYVYKLPSGEIITVYDDITERKILEDSIKNERNKLEMVTKAVGMGLTLISKDYRTVWTNDVIRGIYGETEGMICYETYNQQTSVCPWCGVRKIFEKGDDMVTTEAVSYDENGKQLWSRIVATPVRDEKGEITAALEVVIPITEMKRVELEREKNIKKLRTALGATIQAMALAVETRDPYTAGHQRRVADLARSIATEMGLSSHQIDGLRMASTIHDIGKISIPAEILSKPSKLTELEFSLIKTHAQTGYNMLKDIDFPWPIARIVLEHHERMNGTGYPNGLKKNQILIESEILIVADVVEAMGSHRPYRPAKGIELALEEISKNSGTLYDSEVVGACLKLFNEKNYKLVE